MSNDGLSLKIKTETLYCEICLGLHQRVIDSCDQQENILETNTKSDINFSKVWCSCSKCGAMIHYTCSNEKNFSDKKTKKNIKIVDKHGKIKSKFQENIQIWECQACSEKIEAICIICKNQMKSWANVYNDGEIIGRCHEICGMYDPRAKVNT